MLHVCSRGGMGYSNKDRTIGQNPLEKMPDTSEPPGAQQALLLAVHRAGLISKLHCMVRSHHRNNQRDREHKVIQHQALWLNPDTPVW
jgi:hypothetical protein